MLNGCQCRYKSAKADDRIHQNIVIRICGKLLQSGIAKAEGMAGIAFLHILHIRFLRHADLTHLWQGIQYLCQLFHVIADT